MLLFGMENQKDELITGAEFARRLNISPQSIDYQKKSGKLNGCTYGKKYYYRKSCMALGKNPDNPHENIQSISHKRIAKEKKARSTKNWEVHIDVDSKIEEIRLDEELKKKKPQKKKPTKKPTPHTDTNQKDIDDAENEAATLLSQILVVIKDKTTTTDRTKLDGLKLKATILKEYFMAKNEEIKNRKLEENLFDRDEVIQILSFSMNMIRNSLVNLPNNYAVNLDGLTQKEVKEYVSEDINKILEDLQSVDSQFE